MITLIGSAPGLDRFFDADGYCTDRDGVLKAVRDYAAAAEVQDKVTRKHRWGRGANGFYIYEAVP